MNITVIGAGYVGLVAGACFASRGHEVVCCDVDGTKVSDLQQGHVPIFEPGLDDLVNTGLAKGTLRFTHSRAQALEGSDIAFIAVGTPPNADGSSDLRAVFSAITLISAVEDGPDVVVLKSTVPVGTADRVRERLAASSCRRFTVLNNPEFLREGRAVEDFLFPERVVIGAAGLDGHLERLVSLYEEFVPPEQILVMDSRSAELSKYAANAFLATKISFMNEMARLAEAVGADVELVRGVMGRDPRIGSRYLAPGLGYGGSCLPKDVASLLHMATASTTSMDVLRGVQQTNASQPDRLVEKVLHYFDGQVTGRRIALWGVAFKPDTDDIREAPALRVIDLLTQAGASVVVYDPVVGEGARGAMSGLVSYASGSYDCLEGADGLVVATEWKQFREPDWPRMRQAMRGRVIFDGRNIYDPSVVAAGGFDYYCVGRPPADAQRVEVLVNA